ncbi:hypothetical protein GCM10023321_32370 [Pseudonocardia eucalypti]|uniref:SpoVT-AbrB domain-containing protein n=1 Tax=Pseudonocardia eucalypti TaxID=648755 RepID=A0ABP9Q878_9PSEU
MWVVSGPGVIKPLIPPRMPNRTLRQEAVSRGCRVWGRALPLPSFALSRVGDVVYGLGSVDDRGRVSDVVCPQVMGWLPGARLSVEASAGGELVVRADAAGEFALTHRGHLRLPPAMRRWCGLSAGDRVLLAADPARDQMVLYPPAVLDRLLARAANCRGAEAQG